MLSGSGFCLHERGSLDSSNQSRPWKGWKAKGRRGGTLPCVPVYLSVHGAGGESPATVRRAGTQRSTSEPSCLAHAPDSDMNHVCEVNPSEEVESQTCGR